MKLNMIAKKSIAIFTVLLLILSLNISTNVTAKFEIDEDCGVAFDEFENDASITLENCTYDPLNRSIILEYEPLPFVYNHKDTPKSIEAWYDGQPLLAPGGDLFTFLSQITKPDTLINSPSAEKFDDLSTIDEENDGDYFITVSEYDRFPMEYVYYPLHLFKIQIDENINRLDKFTIDWHPGPYNKDSNIEEIVMYMWAFGNYIQRWEKIGSLDYTVDNINNDSIFYEEDANKFTSEDNFVYVLIVGVPTPIEDIEVLGGGELSSDFLELALSTEEGYNPIGYVKSDIITPTKFYGWENIIWKGSETTDDSNVKIQVLDSNGDLIESLDGNSQGFANSPIDLSSLGKDYPSIILQAILRSDKFDVTPRLYSWAVLWQTIEGFHDSFIYDFRIDKSTGVQIEGGEIKISEFYSDWPIFGKNPANTRSYIGQDIKYEGNKTYWRTYIDKDIGGWFRSPIMSNGRVYIGANDNKIYAFNLSLDPTLDESKYPPIDESKDDYNVESSVAVNNELLILGTSSLETVNKIFALNSSDLTDELWSYSIDNGKTICYSAAPTISNGKVYFTSWSGQFGNSPLISRLMDRVNQISGYLFFNNKLIALDINNGNEIWNPVNLPTASLCPPAVDNGLIFVGCDNAQGPSAFAFNEETGEKIWNVSIGSVGRAAPVVVDGTDKKIVIFTVRERALLSLFNGTDKVVALNAYDGSMLWNFTIGNQSAFLRYLVLSNKNFSNIKATLPPIATPAVFEDTVYIMSPNGIVYAIDVNNGLEKWNFMGSNTFSMAYHTASPVVVDDNVYVINQNILEPQLYILDTSNGQIIDNILLYYEDVGMLSYLYSSPIVTDGLIVVNILEKYKGFLGHIMCFGDYKRNSFGNVYSVPIHVQKDKWWNIFNATTLNTNIENTIKFSILDEDYKLIRGLDNLDGENNDISEIPVNVIRLCAEFEISNVSNEPYPILEEWKITWATENDPPIFIEKSFTPDISGWINTMTPIFTIKVYDEWPGLSVNSAKFRVTYNSNEKSDWITAECTGENGTKTNQTITANLSKLNINGDDLSIKSIEISIKDLSGNEGIFTLEEQFKLDQIKPTSWIDNTILSHYNIPVTVQANASDPGDPNVNKSGVKSVALYYRLKGETSWRLYRSDETFFNWEFQRDTSGDYEICTIATDRAGNVEDFPDDPRSFILDMNKPFKPIFDEEYSFNALPEFSITFEDDYELEKIEYQLNFHGTEEWILINDNINTDSSEEVWSLNQDDWDIMIEDFIYHMYFRITDICGNIYESDPDDEALVLIKDISAPITNVTLDISDFKEGSWRDTFKIIANVPFGTDFEYISLEYSFSTNKDKWSSWKQYGETINKTAGIYEWEFTAPKGTGYYRIKTIITDSAGNIAESPAEIINVILFPTALVSIMAALIVIMFIITLIVIFKMKKKKE